MKKRQIGMHGGSLPENGSLESWFRILLLPMKLQIGIWTPKLWWVRDLAAKFGVCVAWGSIIMVGVLLQWWWVMVSCLLSMFGIPFGSWVSYGLGLPFGPSVGPPQMDLGLFHMWIPLMAFDPLQLGLNYGIFGPSWLGFTFGPQVCLLGLIYLIYFS